MTAVMSVVRISRRLRAPVARVWQAWTEPEWVRRWFGSDPNGSVTSAALDVRVGGAFSVTFRDSNGDEHTCAGEYREVREASLLAFSWRWASEPGVESSVRVALSAADGETVLAFEHGDLHAPSLHDYESGWALTFDKLERALLTSDS